MPSLVIWKNEMRIMMQEYELDKLEQHGIEHPAILRNMMFLMIVLVATNLIVVHNLLVDSSFSFLKMIPNLEKSSSLEVELGTIENSFSTTVLEM
ncbi:20206_t:CDS:2 [Entrophospora sp. SA101]|nr:20206_t:CDS:2 [Entrophospora sp. SA101]